MQDYSFTKEQRNQFIKETLPLFFFASLIYAIGAAERAGVPGMVFDIIRKELGFSASETAMIASSGVIGCMFFISFSGFLIDRYGWRNVILPGVILQILGEYLIYSSSSALWIYIGAFLNGGGRTINYLTLFKLLDTEFDRKRFAAWIGIFYLFSYGGTLFGTAPYVRLAENFSWQVVLRIFNWLTLLCAGAIALIFILFGWRNKQEKLPANPVVQPHWKEMIPFLKKRQSLMMMICAASGIMIYWSILAFAAKKYLTDVCSMGTEILSVMNIIVMAEMVLLGPLSYALSNRRKFFHMLGSGLIFAACLLFAAGCILPDLQSACALIGFIALGVGYGCTCVNLIAVREFVPVSFAATSIGLVNFIANILIIFLTQAGGFIFDCFSEENLQVSRNGFFILFLIYVCLALPSFLFSLFLKDSRGRNISADL